MAAARLLVVEGNTAEARARQVAFGGQVASEGYAQLLRELFPGAVTVDICYPADPGANLPDAGGLEGYDGIAVTGSSLNIYNGGREIGQQVDLMRTAFTTRVPIFGSCWGLQLLTVAAGGRVRRNPRGREVGFGRRIRLTPDGGAHPLFAGKPAVFDAMTVHLDEVEALPEGARLLATNDHSQVQAAAFPAGRTVCWGVQYHPEYPFREMAAIFRRLRPSLVAEGFFLDDDEEAAFIADLEHFEREPGNMALAWRHGIDGAVIAKEVRTRELANWITHQVLPARTARGRG
ncbi:type 1 glutamine amidotransferase [Xanthobacter dioxanivorans]|uniref:Type 1 glutamine amidotransferase n=1 Tax=Xanthobacter dioxanivorans TaxID=2528964 RepID=A0A974PRR1_9HYPH|nr:type 1 glutamine amidotransferase [Xanthobacter dioxanivorans]QRG08256.1 type 1 glutamine amidotransferase [Xanthobacter dioxanivorans]